MVDFSPKCLRFLPNKTSVPGNGAVNALTNRMSQDVTGYRILEFIIYVRTTILELPMKFYPYFTGAKRINQSERAVKKRPIRARLEANPWIYRIIYHGDQFESKTAQFTGKKVRVFHQNKHKNDRTVAIVHFSVKKSLFYPYSRCLSFL